MTPSTKPTPPKWPEPQVREARSREERLASLLRLAQTGVRRPGAV